MSAAIDTDQDLEARIDAAYERMTEAKDELGQRNAWQEMCILVRQRSAAQIFRMENLRRLTR